MMQSAGNTLSRRSFVAGSAMCALAFATGAFGLSGCGSSSDSEEVQVLDVPTNAVTSLDAFTALKHPSRRYEVEELVTLDAGTELFGTGTEVAAALCTGKTARVLSTIALLGLSTGRLNEVLEKAQQDEDGYSLFAVRASDELLVWVESNYLTGDWSVYSAEINTDELSIGTPVKLDSGDSGYDTPEIACIGSNAYWIVQPTEDGAHKDEDSQLKVANGAAASVLCTSHGRFNGGLAVSGQVLTAMPRADVSGVYYQLTAFQAGSGQIVATQVMPRSFKPTCAIYMNNAFSFAIGASYDYGGGIANVGTYYPLGNGEWLRLAKTPVTPAGICDGWIFCKSGSRTVFINTEKRTYFTVDAPDSSTDYGDYSIGVGEVSNVFNYATISKTKGSKQTKTVVVRRIRPRTSV